MKELKLVVGIVLVLIGVYLIGSIYYGLYDSFMNGNLFHYNPIIWLVKCVIGIILLPIGGSLVTRYKI